MRHGGGGEGAMQHVGLGGRGAMRCGGGGGVVSGSGDADVATGT